MTRSWTMVGLIEGLLFAGAIGARGAEVRVYYVDIGDEFTEEVCAMAGWGPIEPATHGGNYGGVDDCRCIWDISDDDPEATLTFAVDKASVKRVVLRHLDGLADDSFEVYGLHANGTWVLLDEYTDFPPASDTKTWFTMTVDLSDLALGRDLTIKLVATGPKWASFGTYGQVAFDWVEVYGTGFPR